MRLGQLLVNAVRPSRPCPELFGIEDEVLARKLDRLAGREPEPLPASDGVSLVWDPLEPLAESTLRLEGARVATFEVEELICSILEVQFVGEYRWGSAGNPDAAMMVQVLSGLLARVEPDVVLLDVSQLRYEWGNSLLRVYELIGRFDTVDPIGVVTLAGPQSRSLPCRAHTERRDAQAEAIRLAMARSRDIG